MKALLATVTVGAVVASRAFGALIVHVVTGRNRQVCTVGQSIHRFLLFEKIDGFLDCSRSLICAVPVGVAIDTEDFAVESSQHLLQMRNDELWFSPQSA